MSTQPQKETGVRRAPSSSSIFYSDQIRSDQIRSIEEEEIATLRRYIAPEFAPDTAWRRYRTRELLAKALEQRLEMDLDDADEFIDTYGLLLCEAAFLKTIRAIEKGFLRRPPAGWFVSTLHKGKAVAWADDGRLSAKVKRRWRSAFAAMERRAEEIDHPQYRRWARQARLELGWAPDNIVGFPQPEDDDDGDR